MTCALFFSQKASSPDLASDLISLRPSSLSSLELPRLKLFNSHATSSFLAKMAVVLSSKPSNTLFVACRRLLELVYKAAPQVKHSNYCIHSAYCELWFFFVSWQPALLQLCQLSMGQQAVLKKVFETFEPDVEALLASTSRLDMRYTAFFRDCDILTLMLCLRFVFAEAVWWSMHPSNGLVQQIQPQLSMSK